MDVKTMYSVLSIIGFFCVLGLGINAYFVRGMLESLNQVKLQTAVLIEKSDSKEVRVSKNEKEIERMRERFHELNTQIHQLKSIELLKEIET